MLDSAATKERVRRYIQPLVAVLARIGLTPNMLTITGVVLNAGVGLIIALGYVRTGGVLLLFTSAFDLLDGALAKATGKTSRFGAFLDSTLDRYSEALVLLGLLWYSVQQNAQWDVYLIYIVIVGSLMVSYTRARAEGLGLQCRVGLLGRPERIGVLSLGLILHLVTPALIILAIFTNVTAVQRMIHVRRETGGTLMDFVTEVPWLFRNVVRKLGQTSTMAVVVALLLATIFVGSAVITACEVATETAGGIRSYFDTVWWFIVTVTGLGLAVAAPVTQVGKAASAMSLMMARIFFGMFIGSIASWMINRLMLEGKGMGTVTIRNHVLICGWNPRGEYVVNLLARDEKRDVVILAELENAPVRAGRVHFVHGDPSMERDLQRASVQTAETVIVLADQSIAGMTESSMDGRSVLVALTVKKMNASAYIVAEVRQGENRAHFINAGVREVLVGNELVSEMLACTSVNHGLTWIVTDLLTSGEGSEIYVVPTPPSLVGKPFDDALIQLQTSRRMILFGITRGEEIVLNPKDPLILTRGDSLVLIAQSLPKLE